MIMTGFALTLITVFTHFELGFAIPLLIYGKWRVRVIGMNTSEKLFVLSTFFETFSNT